METLTLSNRLRGQFVQDGSALPFEDSSSSLSAAAIARGRLLAADSSYPPFAICQQIAAALITDDSSTNSAISRGPRN